MIQAIPANGADEPFNAGVLPRATRRREFLFQAQALHPADKGFSVNTIPIPKQVTGRSGEAAPWDIGSALDGRHKIEPGDTLWIHQGRYKAELKVGGMGYVVRLAGRDGAPVQVRAWKGERVTIDGGLNVQPPSSYLWIWDLGNPGFRTPSVSSDCA